MFKVRQGSDATDRDGVQSNCDNKIFADYFFSRRKGMNRHVKRFFEMNDSVRTKEMKTISVDKGSIIQ